jgi:AraC-like DNA-binding protein
MVTLRTYTAPGSSPVVKSFWYLRVSGLAGTVYKEDILPDGHHEIIFHLTADHAKRAAPCSSWINEPVSFIAGQTLQSYSLELKNDSIIYGIRFYPHTLGPLLGFPADLLTDKIVPLSEFSRAALLKGCITETPEKTFANFERVLMKLASRADLSSNRFSYIQYSVAEIMKHNGDIRIDRLIHKTGVSGRYFDTLFMQSVGITPKAFCKIIKLNHFIQYRNAHPLKSLTECSYEANFFDQSHLIKLFRSVTGKRPGDYFSDANQISNTFAAL